MELSRILIGAMRFKNRQSAIDTVRFALDCGFNYIDNSACYCYQNPSENSESWVGEAIGHPSYQGRAIISAKCTPGNGGLELGEFIPEKGFGVRSVAQFDQVFAQSRKRLQVDRFDFYHLWTTHTLEQLEEAQKPGGWFAGLHKHAGEWDHLGITTHADNETIITFLKTGAFETVTIPLNIINTTRTAVVDYCRASGITVIAMNPLAGGFLAANEQLKELALRYLLSLEGVYPLIGFSCVEDVDYAEWILKSQRAYQKSTGQILSEVDKLIGADVPRCTACGYCQPCPERINVGASLSYYNLYKFMGNEHARKEFRNKQWEDGLRIDKCKQCGICDSRCPNGLEVMKIIKDAQEIMYA
ncbi:MAG: hypothetical protein GF398_08115 [Chitinivibrionales bacterium]|nr:hypothetical protein [Chitinivibrionales bacterium]